MALPGFLRLCPQLGDTGRFVLVGNPAPADDAPSHSTPPVAFEYAAAA